MKNIPEEEFLLDPARWLAAADEQPLALMRGPEVYLVILPKVVFESMHDASREALHISELSEAERAAMRSARMDPKHDYLNALLLEDEDDEK